MAAIKKRISPREESSPVTMTNFGDLPSVLAALVYGRSGTGKTTIASTFPKPLALLDVREEGTDSVSNVEGGKVASIETWDEFEQMYWYFSRGRHPFKTVVIDQLTALQEIAIKKVKRDAGKEDADGTSQRLLGQAGGLMKEWLLNYRDLIKQGIHVVFLAHDRTFRGKEGDDGRDDDQIEPVVGAALMPSVVSFVNGSVKLIGNTFIRETFTIENRRKKRHAVYAMRIGPHAYYTTKVRSPRGIGSPQDIVDPTFDKMVAVMRGTYSDQATSPVRKKR